MSNNSITTTASDDNNYNPEDIIKKDYFRAKLNYLKNLSDKKRLKIIYCFVHHNR